MGKRKTIDEVDAESEACLARILRVRELRESGRYDEADAILDDCRKDLNRIRAWIKDQPENRVAA